ncbi:MAG: hypothetical protein AVDCRST_MAG48-3229, partial [uncultured Friedmanniella sp.]
DHQCIQPPQAHRRRRRCRCPDRHRRAERLLGQQLGRQRRQRGQRQRRRRPADLRPLHGAQARPAGHGGGRRPGLPQLPEGQPEVGARDTGQGWDAERDGEHLLRRAAGPGPEQLLEGPQRAAGGRPGPADGQQRGLPAEVPDDHRRQRPARHAAGAQRVPAAGAEHAAAARQALHQPHRAPVRRRGEGLPEPGQHPHPHVEGGRLQRRHLRHPDRPRCHRQLPLHPQGPVRGRRCLPRAEVLRGAGRDHQGADRPEAAALGLRPVQPAAPAARPDERRAEPVAGGGRQAHPRLRDRELRQDGRGPHHHVEVGRHAPGLLQPGAALQAAVQRGHGRDQRGRRVPRLDPVHPRQRLEPRLRAGADAGLPAGRRRAGELGQRQRLLLHHPAQAAGGPGEDQGDPAGAQLARRALRDRGVQVPALRRGGRRPHPRQRRQPGAHQDRHREHRDPHPLPGRQPVHDLRARPPAGRRHPARLPVAGDPHRDRQPDHRPVLQHGVDQERHGGQGVPRRHLRHRPGPPSAVGAQEPRLHLEERRRRRDAQGVRGAAADGRGV